MSEFRLNDGDCLVLYTDGIIEAIGRDGKFFGTERLTAIIERYGGRSASEIHAAIIADLKDYEKPDDVTLFVMKRKDFISVRPCPDSAGFSHIPDD